MTVQILKQKSKKLEQLLADLGPDFGKLEAKVNSIFEQGKKEGFSDMEIGEMIRFKMQEHYSDRTIRRVLPDTAKHTKHVSEHKTQPDILSGSERKPLEMPAGKVKVEDATTTQEPKVDAQPRNSIALEQPGPKEVKGIHNIAPEEYKLEDLEEYDKDLYIRIIKYLDKNIASLHQSVMKWDKQVHDLAVENTTLKKQPESVKPFVELFPHLPPETRDSWLQFMKNALEREKGLRKC